MTLAPPWLVPLAAPVSSVYALVMRLRNRRFDRRGPRSRVPVPVVSIGNLSVGGVGKTPFVTWLAETLCEEGRRPVIALRGYGAETGTDGDEAAEYRRRLPDVPVLVDPDRRRAIQSFLDGGGAADVVLLDDGFQHRRLHRDLDLVLIDVTRPPYCDHVLPWGRLREPRSGLTRADAVVLTHADDATAADAVAAELTSAGVPPCARARHAWRDLEVRKPDGRTTHESVAWLRGRRLVASLGVGHPEAVIAQAEAAGARVEVRPVRDHHVYGSTDVADLRARCRGTHGLLITAKDDVKLGPLVDSDWPVPIVVPRLVFDVFAGRDELLRLVHAVVEAGAASAT